MYLTGCVKSRNQFKCLFFIQFGRFASTKFELYQKCYDLLKVSPDSDQDTVRAAYIQIVKKVHPDSGHTDASAEKFTEIDNAFRILQAKYVKERRGITDDVDPVKEYDIKHTAPQHRQYLSYDGVGYGTPAQREKQYQQSRATKAYGKVIEYRIDKLSASEAALMKPGTFFKEHTIKTKYGFDRVVEDLIQEAMFKGDFNDLQGRGKPLSNAQSQNPYVDFIEHKINKILLDNGFTPEWITLQKEIRTEIDDLTKTLIDRRSYLSEAPLTDAADIAEWEKIVGAQYNRVQQINEKIDKFNLIVPILDQQMFRIQLDRISDRVLCEKPNIAERKKTPKKLDHKDSTATRQDQSILSYLMWWL